MEKQWFIYTESGECVEVETREEAMARFRKLYRRSAVTETTVLTEEEYETGRTLGSW